MSKIIGKIENISVLKEGETEGRSWSLYKVIINGKTFTSFDAGFKELVGKEGEWEYEEKEVEKGGEIYTRRTLKFPKQEEIEKITKEIPSKPETFSKPSDDNIMNALKEIYKKLDEVGIRTDKLNEVLERFENEDRVVFYPTKKEEKKEPF